MVAIFARIECQFWADKRVRREMSEDARILFLYLLSSPHRNIIGLYYLPESYATNDLGWTAKRYQAAMEELIRLDRISFDDETDLILVHNHLKHNPLENPNQVKSAISNLECLNDTFLFRKLLSLVNKCQKASYEVLSNYLINRSRTLSEPFLNPLETVNEPLKDASESVSKPNPNPDTNTDPNQNTYTLKSAEPTTASPTKKDIEFLVDEYRLILGGILPDIKKLTEERTRKAKGILKEFAVDEIVQAFKETAASDFLTGNTPKGWKANWDWIFNKANLAKILEGNYRNNRTGGPGPRTPKGIQGLADLMNGGSDFEN